MCFLETNSRVLVLKCRVESEIFNLFKKYYISYLDLFFINLNINHIIF